MPAEWKLLPVLNTLGVLARRVEVIARHNRGLSPQSGEKQNHTKQSIGPFKKNSTSEEPNCILAGVGNAILSNGAGRWGGGFELF